MQLTASVGEIVKYSSVQPPAPEQVESGPPPSVEAHHINPAALEAQRRRAGIFRRNEDAPRKIRGKAGIRRVEQEISPVCVHKENEMETVDQTAASGTTVAPGAETPRRPVMPTREDALLGAANEQADYLHRIANASEQMARQPKMFENLGRDVARGAAVGGGFLLAMAVGELFVLGWNWAFGKKPMPAPTTP